MRCQYCRPSGRNDKCISEKPLKDTELLDLVSKIHEVRPLSKIRLTGGEPLLRKGLLNLIQGIRQLVPGVEIGMTTNGLLLKDMAWSLRHAGLDSINISLDTLDSNLFSVLTRGGQLKDVLDGIQAARNVGFPTRLNAVLLRSVNADSLPDLVRLALGHGCEMRFIELMPFGEGGRMAPDEFVPADEALWKLGNHFTHVKPLGLKGTARRHLFRNGDKHFTVGFITPTSKPFCDSCNRFRLDCQGRIYSCLRDMTGLDLMRFHRQGEKEGLRAKILEGLERKTIYGESAPWPSKSMVSIGG